ncbi:MAG: hypothetical protein M3O15_15005, partial [Acidobacteriota bacterium]|nr:hypothetical protein [Acidobacteriota bacterium]
MPSRLQRAASTARTPLLAIAALLRPSLYFTTTPPAATTARTSLLTAAALLLPSLPSTTLSAARTPLLAIAALLLPSFLLATTPPTLPAPPPTTAATTTAAAETPADLGQIAFPTSAASPEARSHFLRGVLLLH